MGKWRSGDQKRQTLKRVKMEEKRLWPMEGRCFERYHPRPQMAPLPRDWGFATYSYPLLSHERVKLRTSNFVGAFTGSIGTKAHKMLVIVAVGV